ncbi:MAG: hypothetical protein K2G70_01110 [Turicibacter sp.]|nr:hypothetical protein [Turicibacter sp.]
MKDTRQEIRAKLLETRILLKDNSDIEPAQKVLNEVIEILKNIYQDDSFWLIEPYDLYRYIDNRYSEKLIRLRGIYVPKREDANMQLKQFIQEAILTRPSIE